MVEIMVKDYISKFEIKDITIDQIDSIRDTILDEIEDSSLKNIILSCLDKDPSKRPNFDEVKNELTSLLNDSSIN
jgi:serine/threonine protein kinase